MNGEDFVQERHIHDHSMQQDWISNGKNEPWVDKGGHNKKGVIFTDCIQRVEHFNDNKDWQTEGRRFNLAFYEVVAGVVREIHALHKVVHLEVGPGGALWPVRKLLKCDQSVIVSRFGHSVPVNENAHSSETHIDSNHHVAEENPVGN